MLDKINVTYLNFEFNPEIFTFEKKINILCTFTMYYIIIITIAHLISDQITRNRVQCILSASR